MLKLSTNTTQVDSSGYIYMENSMHGISVLPFLTKWHHTSDLWMRRFWRSIVVEVLDVDFDDLNMWVLVMTIFTIYLRPYYDFEKTSKRNVIDSFTRLPVLRNRHMRINDIDRFFRIFTRKNHIWISGSLGIERVDLGRPDLWTRRTSYTLFFKSR
ncbi:hypothetical protein RCL_jg8186.t1 [Rhizophagus clarus]|uniref:Uncharacterized protein n=1 Tax=Rhizophagus clarus TaxID=94130 RepID=A0A8H3MER2_9GLOM|nr:hypothetical protein RCL_jg8186.t1 [Rhizophagus clarus]